MNFKKIGKAILFPHMAVMISLVPVATVLLVYSLIFLGDDSPISYVAYSLSAYTLCIWCIRIPRLIRFIKDLKDRNKYAQMWISNDRLRVSVSLYGSLLWNTAYALLQLGIGFYHHSFWFYSLAGYYICLAGMRFFLALHTTRFKPREKMLTEFSKYRACAWIFLVMNIALGVMVFFMIRFGRTFEHDMITSIAMAAYTFTAFVVAIVNIVKYRKYNSPVYSASKAVSFSAACVSMLTLESTMLNTFGTEADGEFNMTMLAWTGAAVVVIILIMAVYMIVRSTKQLGELKRADKNGAE